MTKEMELRGCLVGTLLNNQLKRHNCKQNCGYKGNFSVVPCVCNLVNKKGVNYCKKSHKYSRYKMRASIEWISPGTGLRI